MRNNRGQFIKGKMSGNNNPFYGRRHTKKSRRKMSESLNGRSVWNKGKTCPQLSLHNNPNWRGGKPKCKKCGKKLVSVYATFCRRCYSVDPERIRKFKKKTKGRIAWNKGKPNLKNRGKNHPRWNGGNRTEREIDMGRCRYCEWRRLVFERDNYTCQLCGLRGGELQAHHILPYRDFEQFRYNTKNGVTLCKPCHLPTINNEFLYIPKFLNV
jgi:5-methylcytosine-specific restriction endonuclease McrA